MVIFVTASDLDYAPPLIEGDCCFLCTLNDTELYQVVHVRHFSLLIDSGQAVANLSAYFRCPFSVGSAYVQITFYTKALIRSEPNSTLIRMYVCCRMTSTILFLFLQDRTQNLFSISNLLRARFPRTLSSFIFLLVRCTQHRISPIPTVSLTTSY